MEVYMKINNKKGHVYFAGLVLLPAHQAAAATMVFAFKAAFAAIMLAAIWHIPAWEQAKDNHTEAIYQAQQMWPQQLFSGPRTEITYKNGNGGNFIGGVDKG